MSKSSFLLRLLAPVLLCVQGALAGAADLDVVRERGVLEVAVYDEFPPYGYRDGGRAAGVDVDIARALADKLGLKASIRLVGADENMEDDLRNNVWKGHYLGGGTADVMMHVPVDADFARANDQVFFLAPYHREEIVLAWNQARSGELGTMQLLLRHKVGVELDTISDFYLLGAMGGQIRPNIVHYRSLSQATDALRAGELMSVMGPRTEVEGGIAGAPGIATVVMQMPGMRGSGWDLGLAVKEGNTALALALDEAMEQLRGEGTLDAIFARHGVKRHGPVAKSLVEATAR